MRTSTSISPAEAAKRIGRDKATITRAIAKGQLSAFREDSGRFWIEPAELARAFPDEADKALHGVAAAPAAPSRIISGDAGKAPDAEAFPTDARTDAKLDALKRQLEQEKDERARERRQQEETISDLRRRLDASEEERRQKDTQLTALLTDQRKPVETPPEPPKKGLLGRWFWN